MKNAEFKSEITYMNAFLCMTVILIHLLGEPVMQLDKSGILFIAALIPWRLSTFVVQGFILLSGIKLFLKKKDEINYPKYYLARFTKIIVPYIVWVMIYYIYFCSKNYFDFSIKEAVGFMLDGTLVAHLYFVVVIVQFYLLAPLWRYVFGRLHPMVGIVFSVLITAVCFLYMPSLLKIVVPDFDFVYNDRIFTSYLMYWCMGCYIGKNYDEFMKILESKRAITVIFLVCAIVQAWLSCLNYTGVYLVEGIEMMNMIYVVSAILFFYMVFLYVAKNTPRVPHAVTWISSASYYIYLVHCFVILLVNDRIENQFTIIQRFFIKAFLVYSVSIVCCVIYTITKAAIKRRLLKT